MGFFERVKNNRERIEKLKKHHWYTGWKFREHVSKKRDAADRAIDALENFGMTEYLFECLDKYYENDLSEYGAFSASYQTIYSKDTRTLESNTKALQKYLLGDAYKSEFGRKLFQAWTNFRIKVKKILKEGRIRYRPIKRYTKKTSDLLDYGMKSDEQILGVSNQTWIKREIANTYKVVAEAYDKTTREKIPAVPNTDNLYEMTLLVIKNVTGRTETKELSMADLRKYIDMTIAKVLNWTDYWVQCAKEHPGNPQPDRILTWWNQNPTPKNYGQLCEQFLQITANEEAYQKFGRALTSELKDKFDIPVANLGGLTKQKPTQSLHDRYRKVKDLLTTQVVKNTTTKERHKKKETRHLSESYEKVTKTENNPAKLEMSVINSPLEIFRNQISKVTLKRYRKKLEILKAVIPNNCETTGLKNIITYITNCNQNANPYKNTQNTQTEIPLSDSMIEKIYSAIEQIMEWYSYCAKERRKKQLSNDIYTWWTSKNPETNAKIYESFFNIRDNKERNKFLEALDPENQKTNAQPIATGNNVPWQVKEFIENEYKEQQRKCKEEEMLKRLQMWEDKINKSETACDWFGPDIAKNAQELEKYRLWYTILPPKDHYLNTYRWFIKQSTSLKDFAQVLPSVIATYLSLDGNQHSPQNHKDSGKSVGPPTLITPRRVKSVEWNFREIKTRKLDNKKNET